MSHLLRFSYILAGVLLSQTCCTFAQSRGTFRKPTTASDQRITAIQNKLLTVQADILNLSTAVASGNSTEELKTRLTHLESHFQTLSEKLTDERRQESIGQYHTAIALLTTQYEALQKRLTSLQKTIGDKIKAEEIRSLPERIQDAIKSHKSRHAEELLIQMADNTKIQGIVHAVYDNSIGNIDLILDFSKDLTRNDFRSAVLNALLYEMRSNGHRSPYKLIAMVRAIESSVMMDNAASEREKATAGTMISELVEDLKSSSEEILKIAMYNGTYAQNVEIEKLSDLLIAFRSDILLEIMPKVVDGSFSDEAADKILDNVYSHKDISQIISGMVALFDKLKSTGNSSNGAMITMGYYLKELQGRDTYKTVSAAQKDAVRTVISKLPTCVKSIVFERYMCIYSRGDYPVVYTWYPGYPLTQGGWKVTKSGDKFYFENHLHPKFYLYSGEIDSYGENSRRFVNAIRFEGDRIDDKGAWNMELNGEFCYFKNVQYKEYMLATFQKPSSMSRFVYTWTAGTKLLRESHQWQLRKC